MQSLPFKPVFDVGRTVCGARGKYKLTGRLGNGWSLASLFKAQEPSDGNGVNVKRFPPLCLLSESFRANFTCSIGLLSKRVLLTVGHP